MTLRFGALLCAFAIAAACGGGKKAGKTTPGGGTGSDGQSMTDKDPVGDGGGTGGADGDGGGSAGLPTPGGGTTDPTSPAVVAPNHDIDPAQAKTQVDAHLTIAKKALSQPTPDPEVALREARAALAIDAANVDAAAFVAFAYYHKRLYDTAELVLDDLFKREAAKQNANVYYVYGLVYDATNRPDRAQLAYRKAVEINPNHTSALVNLGVHQLKNSQYTEAQATFERLTQQFNRNDAITLTSLGSAYRGRSADYPPGAGERAKFVQTAEASYKRALQANASYGPAYYNLGLLYLDTDPYPGIADPMQRLTAAKAFFEQYKNMPGVDIKLYDSRMKDVDKAIKRVQKQQKKKKTS
ncbi:MAG: tetratricopeptide repeat protein [Deltaproteobacteria bacterium]|nr:tetratricopeptide repeat protein [Deltaproteobacteria bacterium]MDQ3297295.1 tetratricopeptide repeat protein [Myxococcota bacterium]